MVRFYSRGEEVQAYKECRHKLPAEPERPSTFCEASICTGDDGDYAENPFVTISKCLKLVKKDNSSSEQRRDCYQGVYA